ncbi:hypothetical protein [Clostridium perfringens]|uniref:hypothetical protein n=5 Tax=Clostridium perfringens TaxID=1502 RepID=UPI003221F129
MKKQFLSKLTLLAVTGTICTSVFAPSLTAYASERNSKNISVAYSSSNFITVDGITYSAEDIANSIKPNIDYTVDYGEDVRERSAVTKAIKTALKWLRGNWAVVYSKLPNWMKKYVVFDQIFDIADRFIGISDSVEDFFHRLFRAVGMPENVNWFLTNVIMILLPI